MIKVILVIILFVIVGGLFVYKNFAMKSAEDKPQTLQVGKNLIYVADQKPGMSVVIQLATISKNGYVVIYDENRGEPQNIIGNSRILTAGKSENIVVGLIRQTVDGESLFAILHEDNGDDAFYPAIDAPFRDEDDNTIFMRFEINQGAPGAAEVKIL